MKNIAIDRMRLILFAVLCGGVLFAQSTCYDNPEQARKLRDYLSSEHTSSITSVDAGVDAITIKGSAIGGENISLCEVTPYEDIVETRVFKNRIPVNAGTFSKTLDRYVVKNGFRYDRTLSRWLIVKDNEGGDSVISHARYADQIEAIQQTVVEKPSSKKGIGDCQATETMLRDLDDLGITSATVNIRITTMMYSQSGTDRLEHSYGGQKYYFDKRQLQTLDESLIACRDRGIIVAAIILINRKADSVDPVIGELFQHPDFTDAGRYSMPDMTTPESINAYAAALDFFAQRYCRTDKKYGRIHHWIMHNEVDSGREWTNMGDGKPVEVYMDTYVKSMRMCHNIVRRYDRYSQVMASHTHAWAVADNKDTYASLDMLNILNSYCRAEGDFKWGLAFHCYPHDLREPKTWLDTIALYNHSTPIITYKNLEVLDHWIKLPVNKYQGKDKRTLWLSENGTNSPTYSDEDLAEQAAGFAWGWTKIAALDGIDAHQWHNWADHEEEFGLRIGLRKYPKDDYARKPVWYAYQAAGTENQDKVFQQYLPVIGIDSWNIIQPVE